MDIIPFPTDGSVVAPRDPGSDEVMASRGVIMALPLATPGHIFTLQWLQDAFGMTPKPSDTASFEAWNAQRARLIDLWRTEMLVSNRVHIEKRPRRGYMVIAPEETPFVAVKVALRDFSRAIQQASDKIQYAPDGLTNHQRQHRNDALAYLGKVELAIKHARPKPPRPGQRAITAPVTE